MSRITPLKPPGGECHLTLRDSEEEEDLKLHSKVRKLSDVCLHNSYMQYVCLSVCLSLFH